MKAVNKKAIWEAVKEVARLALFAAIAAVLSWAATQVANLDPNSVYTIVLAAALRFADKWVHENKDIKANGLAPF